MEKTYTYTLSHRERNTLIVSLSHFFPHIALPDTGIICSPPQFLALVERLIESRPDTDRQAKPTPEKIDGREAASRVLAPPSQNPSTFGQQADRVPQPRDRWAHNRQGVEEKPDGDIETKEVTITAVQPGKTKTGGTMWRVEFRGGKASCFDKTIAGWLSNALAAGGSSSTGTVHFVRSGQYLNVVGIRA